jgi:branched-chain amino acid transport system ATP-binding protein
MKRSEVHILEQNNQQTERIIELRNLNTYYGRSHILQGLSMHVSRHEAVSILGRNGVGKTTTIRSILGLITSRFGEIIIGGEETSKWPPHKIVRKGIAYIPAERQIFPGLSVEENLRLAFKPKKGETGWTVEKIYNRFPVLAQRNKQDGSTLSGGEQQMLAIGRGLVTNPLVMLIDEPTQGLAPILVKDIVLPILRSCVQEGLTILFVEQNYKIALEVGTRHYLMKIHGQISQVATTEELKNDEELVKRHLSV